MNKQEHPLNEDLATKLIHALTGNAESLFQSILDPDLEVISAALKNPALSEDHLLALLKRRDLSEDIPNKIYQRNKKKLSHRLMLAIVKNRATSDIIFRTLLPQLHLFELVDVCFLPGSTADRKLSAERNILQRLPTTPLGSKISLSRRASANVVTELLKEGNPLLTETCLSSPRLKEAAIYQLLTGSRATAEIISMIARHSRWNQRPNLRMAILRNNHTPEIWFTLWLPKLSLPILKQLAAGHKLTPPKKRLVTNELKRRTGL